jgi:hypothetical protein
MGQSAWSIGAGKRKELPMGDVFCKAAGAGCAGVEAAYAARSPEWR